MLVVVAEAQRVAGQVEGKHRSRPGRESVRSLGPRLVRTHVVAQEVELHLVSVPVRRVRGKDVV